MYSKEIRFKHFASKYLYILGLLIEIASVREG